MLLFLLAGFLVAFLAVFLFVVFLLAVFLLAGFLAVFLFFAGIFSPSYNIGFVYTLYFADII
ncbi:MAG TPA: hypothetical protein ENH96_03460 [Chlamydiae bacterium]|nr:hypothetical protein [Chlamydiota bacterium]